MLSGEVRLESTFPARRHHYSGHHLPCLRRPVRPATAGDVAGASATLSLLFLHPLAMGAGVACEVVCATAP